MFFSHKKSLDSFLHWTLSKWLLKSIWTNEHIHQTDAENLKGRFLLSLVIKHSGQLSEDSWHSTTLGWHQRSCWCYSFFQPFPKDNNNLVWALSSYAPQYPPCEPNKVILTKYRGSCCPRNISEFRTASFRRKCSGERTVYHIPKGDFTISFIPLPHLLSLMITRTFPEET